MRRKHQRPVPEGKKRFSISTAVTISVCTEVVAASEEDAKSIAFRRGVQSLCHQCSSGDPSVEWSLTGELDGDLYEENILDVSVLEDE